MIVGLILIGTMLGAVASAGALLVGASIWITLLVYAVVNTVSVLGLALSVALRPDPEDRADQAKPYALAGPQRG